jgi:hypothetical protein
MIAGLGSGVPRGLIQGHRLPEQLFCLSNITGRLPDQSEIIPEHRFGTLVCCPLKEIQRLLIAPVCLLSPPPLDILPPPTMRDQRSRGPSLRIVAPGRRPRP